MNRSSQNVPIVSVGEIELVDQVLVASDCHVADRVVHQPPGAIKPGRVEVWPVRSEVAEHFLNNQIRPFCRVNPTRISTSLSVDG